MSLFPVDTGFPLHFLEKIILKNGFQTSALDTWEYLRFWQAYIIEFWKSLFESRRIFFFSFSGKVSKAIIAEIM